MPLTHPPIVISPADPRSPEATGLIADLSAELAGRYDYAEDGSGHFKPDHHFAFEGVAWYWHFVDVVWLGLFIFVYLL